MPKHNLGQGEVLNKQPVQSNELRAFISQKMGWWSPDGFDAYPDKTEKVIQVIHADRKAKAEELLELVERNIIGNDIPDKDGTTTYDSLSLTSGARNSLRLEQRKALNGIRKDMGL